MNPVHHILDKLLVKAFYTRNASFFLVVVGLAAGFMRSYEHIALAEFFISSITLIMIPIAVWVFYTLKVIRFIQDTLRDEENNFVFSVSFLSNAKQFIAFTRTFTLLLFPVLLYDLFLILIAQKYQAWFSLGVLVIVPAALIVVSTGWLLRRFKHPHQQKNVWVITTWLNATITKPFYAFFPEWILRRQPLSLLGTKAFSGILIFGIAKLYVTDTYDLRLFQMGIIIAFSANLNLIWEMHRFDNYHLHILRNLPIPVFMRIGYNAIAVILITIPELIIVVRFFPGTFDTMSQAATIALGWSIPMVLYGCLYIRDWDPERLTSLVFFGSFAMIILILFKVPGILLAGLNLATCVFIWKQYYYLFQYRSEASL